MKIKNDILYAVCNVLITFEKCIDYNLTINMNIPMLYYYFM